MNALCYWIAILLGADRLGKSETGMAIWQRAWEYDIEQRRRNR